MSSAALIRRTNSIARVNQGGGDKKAGIAPTGGKGQFSMRAIKVGHGHPASTFIPSKYPISAISQTNGVNRIVQSRGRGGGNVNVDIIANQANALCLVNSSGSRRCGYVYRGVLQNAGRGH